ncbi:MAG: LCP family protein [Oscillospiraceae bacterium]|nr:LCP family protein [Oscillospiraceae bacterium]
MFQAMDDVYISNQKNNQYSDFYSDSSRDPQREPEHDGNQRPRKKKKKRSLLKFLMSVLLVLAVIFAIGYAFVFSMMLKIDYNESGHKNNVYVNSSDLMSGVGVQNILLIGVDARPGETVSRSDTMMLLSIDKTRRKIKLTSFLRDTWVDIPGHYYAKLNASCALGGAQLVMDTIEYNFNIKIDNYMLVNFEVFKSVVNRLGGVEVDITEKEARYLRNVVHLTTIKAGQNVHLNGNQALWYCRIRYLDDDFMRTSRQRKVISSILGKARKTNVLELMRITNDSLPEIESDMSAVTLTNLAMGASLMYLSFDIETQQIPADNTWKNGKKSGQDVLIANFGENREVLKAFLYSN